MMSPKKKVGDVNKFLNATPDWPRMVRRKITPTPTP
jgi:hypothetical protein